MTNNTYKRWVCLVCGWRYDEAVGDAKEGFPPGTRWQDIPDDWLCPDCGVGKKDFVMVEVTEAEPVSEQKQSEHPVIIIGSGYAGLSQVKALRVLSKDIAITLICADDGKEYPKPSLSIALTQGKQPDELVRQNAEALEKQHNIKILNGTRVTKIDKEKQCLVTDKGQSLHYHRLVLALGATSIALNAASDADGICYVNHLDDYRLFYERLQNSRSVLIIGCGLIGCEFANDIYNYGEKNAQIKASDIHVVGLSDYPLQPVVPEQAGLFLKNKLPISWHLGKAVTALKKQNKQWFVTLDDKQSIGADLVLVAIGLKAQIDLAKQSGLTVDKGIVVNSQMQSSDKNIFAIGDCAQLNAQVLPFIAPINHQSKAVAATIFAQSAQVVYPAMPIKVKVPSAGLVFLPPPPSSPVNWSVSETDTGIKALNHGKKGRVNGFVLMGDKLPELGALLSKTDINN